MKKITVAVCLDDEEGMIFNNRRQSRDRVLIAELLDSTEGKIYIHPYSLLLFGDNERIVVSDDPLGECTDGAIAFIEQLPIKPYIDSVGSFIVYRWNRLYPAEKYFDIDLEKEGFKLETKKEFVGSSHDNIEKGIYRR